MKDFDKDDQNQTKDKTITTYVESDDAIVSCIISLCSAMCHMDLIDVILWRMTSISFSSMW